MAESSPSHRRSVSVSNAESWLALELATRCTIRFSPFVWLRSGWTIGSTLTGEGQNDNLLLLFRVETGACNQLHLHTLGRLPLSARLLFCVSKVLSWPKHQSICHCEFLCAEENENEPIAPVNCRLITRSATYRREERCAPHSIRYDTNEG